MQLWSQAKDAAASEDTRCCTELDCTEWLVCCCSVPHSAPQLHPGSLYTVHCTLLTVHCTLYTVNCKLYDMYCVMYFIHYTLSAAPCKQFSVNFVQYNLYWNSTQWTVRYILYAVHYALYAVCCEMCTVYCKMYNLCWTLNTVVSTLFSVHYTQEYFNHKNLETAPIKSLIKEREKISTTIPVQLEIYDCHNIFHLFIRCQQAEKFFLLIVERNSWIANNDRWRN